MTNSLLYRYYEWRSKSTVPSLSYLIHTKFNFLLLFSLITKKLTRGPNTLYEINDRFTEALRLMKETSNNIFITGRAGTGKTTLLKYFRYIIRKIIVVLAPTGVAAVNIAGQTIYSFFGFKPDMTVEKVLKVVDILFH